MTIANWITIARLLSIPFIGWSVVAYTAVQPHWRVVALAAFLAAALSDAVDGFIARVFCQKSRLGAILDPIADKLLINVTLVFLAVNETFAHPVPQWFPALVLGRDVVISMGAYVLSDFFQILRVRPRLTGKLTTVFQLAYIVAVLLACNLAGGLLYAATAMTIISLIDYFIEGLRQARRKGAA
ncbi:MAG TPA: CDP-alcohol phosphatidyltransferase family protein [Candidatus Hydrogenedentes bacterium]|nr:CDP-alcohol phosphatidyltransferase family protein [Candidatus Hydrogenedentota bacterium]HQE84146.1 CDP-alcohol phosphatidyltransferase family protein [Candidatus Hydrogenedentota bacterium]HQH52183.1 CDP-alcohol phosphatidyltransferase family protein [Candidatus Hydrogenedentota bacterium]HQM47614.1 CDP-alcohol phosphatidyltransferase family protein [Candidatus Hydrogenedentota bacterium]